MNDTVPTGKYKELISWGKTIVSALVIALLINNFLIVNATVASGSMESTIMTGDRVLCSRLSYLSSPPERFDIVVFTFRQGKEPVQYVKRVIGLPGERVEIVEGKVYIDGSEEPLPDSFTNEEPVGSYGPFLVPEGRYFLLGDNRNESYDSKSWPDHFIPKEDILGKAFLTYYPHIHRIDNP